MSVVPNIQVLGMQEMARIELTRPVYVVSKRQGIMLNF